MNNIQKLIQNLNKQFVEDSHATKIQLNTIKAGVKATEDSPEERAADPCTWWLKLYGKPKSKD